MNIFLVEDDHEIVNLLTFYLEKENWIVTTSLNLKNALDTINSNFSIFVVDLYLPDGDGLELVKYMKNNFPNTPIIIISAKTSSLDRVIGLELGADDYIVKPFLPQELIYRIKHNKALNQKKRKQSISGYTIDFEKRLIMADQEIIVLSTKEYDLLIFMLTNIGNALSREQLLTHVWDNAEYINDRSIDNQIKNIRKKLPNLTIDTIYGYGYRLNK
ncbi:TPA: response regulator transcription factor [Enterococcus faecalis]